jgi:hypothetical protein
VRLPFRAARDPSRPPSAQRIYDLAGKLVVTRARLARIIDRVDVCVFVRDGYVAVRGAFGEDVARACREMIWGVLRERGISPDDRATWAPPLIRINCPDGEPFAAAGTSPRLHAAYDELLGGAGGPGGPGSAAPCRCASSPRTTPARWATRVLHSAPPTACLGGYRGNRR